MKGWRLPTAQPRSGHKRSLLVHVGRSPSERSSPSAPTAANSTPANSPKSGARPKPRATPVTPAGRSTPSPPTARRCTSASSSRGPPLRAAAASSASPRSPN